MGSWPRSRGIDAELDPGSQWWPTAQLLEGICSLLADETDRADPILTHAAEVATEARALPAAAIALAERSLVAMDQQTGSTPPPSPNKQQMSYERGTRQLCCQRPGPRRAGAGSRAPGRRATRPEQLARATRLRPLLTYALPYLAVQTLLELGRVCLALDDTAGVRVVLRQAREILRLRPDLGILPTQVDELRSKLDTSRGTVGVSSLTTAELPLLPTRLTLPRSGNGSTSPSTRPRARPPRSTASSASPLAARLSSACRSLGFGG